MLIKTNGLIKHSQDQGTQLFKMLGVLSLISLILTILWLVCLIIGIASSGRPETIEAILSHLGSPSILFYLTYVNAALLTAIVVTLFTVLFLYIRKVAPMWSAIGIVFVPIYGGINLIAYLSQVTVVPRLLHLRAEPKYQFLSECLLRQIIQQWPDSAVFVFNNLAYALLGIPSIIFGVLMAGSVTSLRTGGVLLGFSGVASIAGFIGIVAQNARLSQGSLFGGMLFLLALIHLSWVLLYRRQR